MGDFVVRLSSLTLQNIKNVKNIFIYNNIYRRYK